MSFPTMREWMDFWRVQAEPRDETPWHQLVPPDPAPRPVPIKIRSGSAGGHCDVVLVELCDAVPVVDPATGARTWLPIGEAVLVEASLFETSST